MQNVSRRIVALSLCVLFSLVSLLAHAQSPLLLWKRKEHTSLVYSVAFSPNGAMLASGSEDNTARFWKRTDGTPMGTLQHSDRVTSVAFSPDGNLLAAGNYYDKDKKPVKLWGVATQTLQYALDGHRSYVRKVTFSPDGSLLASSSGDWNQHDNTIKLWRTSDGTLVRTFSGHTVGVGTVAFSSDGTMLASGSWDNTVKLWRVSDGAVIRTLTGHSQGIYSVAFTPDGKILASGSWDGTVKLWNVTDGTLLRTHQATSEPVFSVPLFSSDGKTLMTLGSNATVSQWEVSTGNLLKRYTLETTAGIASLSLSSDGSQLAYGCNDGTLFLVQLLSPNITVSGKITLPYCVNKAQPMFFVFVSEDGSKTFRRVLSLNKRGEFQLKDIPRGKYAVWIKGTKWLAKEVEVDALGGDVTGVEATLLPGDANNDNSVDIFDLAIVAEAYGSTPFEPEWTPQADFTCDNIVDIFDLAIVAENYGEIGDP